MASESAPGGVKHGIKGWVKGVIGSVLGLVGGAMIAYVTPLVENVVKPGKPVANFALQVQGLTVAFNNRSAGASQGWWDFGDGSALEPYNPADETISHTYPKAGNYTVKLTLANLLGEAGERTVGVNVDPAAAPPPTIVAMQVDPLTPGSCAPALFRVRADLKDATQCIWSLDDGRPVEIVDAAATQEKFLSFKDPGTYTVRLVALNGKQQVQAEKVVNVAYYADTSAAQATLNVTYQGQQVERHVKRVAVAVEWKAAPQAALSPFTETRMLDNAERDFQIIAIDVMNKNDPRVKSVAYGVTPDRKQFIVKGQLVRPSGWGLNKPPVNGAWLADVKLGLERRSVVKALPQEPITVCVKEVGTTAIPIPLPPSNCQAQQKQMSLVLTDGGKEIYKGPTPPAGGAQVMLKNRPVRLTAREQNGQLVLELADLRSPLRPAGN